MIWKKLIFIFAAVSMQTAQAGPTLERSISRLERDWAEAYYRMAPADQAAAYERLLARAEALRSQYPDSAEPLIWEANLLCTYAGVKGGLEALTMIKQAKKVLERAIALDSEALEGAAYVTLGTLYYMVPGWPIAFGDDARARKYLQAALRINPKGIDTNYFFGDFLLSQGEQEKAVEYFNKALEAPIRPNQAMVDNLLKQEVELALNKASEPKVSGFRSLFQSIVSSFRSDP